MRGMGDDVRQKLSTRCRATVDARGGRPYLRPTDVRAAQQRVVDGGDDVAHRDLSIRTAVGGGARGHRLTPEGDADGGDQLIDGDHLIAVAVAATTGDLMDRKHSAGRAG